MIEKRERERERERKKEKIRPLGYDPPSPEAGPSVLVRYPIPIPN